MIVLGNLLDFRRDALQLFTDSAHRFGDIVRFRLGPQIVHLLNHPDYIEHVLQYNSHNYDKQTRSAAKVKTVCGNGLLSSDGELWRRQRRMMQPAFHQDLIGGLASVMTEATTTMLKQWERYAESGEPLDVTSEMMRLTCTIAGRAFFSSDVSGDADTIERSLAVILEHTWRRLQTPFDFGSIFPMLLNPSYRKAIGKLDQIIYRIINQRRRVESSIKDLLSMLLQARDGESGEAMDDKQLRDETITMLLAGHETTANALARTFYVLSQFPRVEEQLRAELMDVLGGRIPTLQDIPKLKYTTMLIKETVRLYPSIWIIERRAISDDDIGGYHIPAGSSVVISPYALHRHPEFWEDPDRFDPERFTPERWTERQQNAYIPFGKSHHQCIGKDFAMLEARLIVAMVAQIFHLHLVPGHPVVSKPGITLGLRDGLLMTVSR